ncbi:high frequency lysogenization protein HflD [Spartinivicinus ruber]|uniref:high frequency lysogenization protein HflD n=1 Tax=Spartinivicinus ruber TaxID=2683272 RepID=UPI0013D55F8B|nr:high frequency lysogenization protein HflD [Spartinivicinus ruber]
MASHNYHNQLIALAGVFQASHLVEQIAKQGQAPADALETSISSILSTNPENVEAVYDGLSGLTIGFNILRQILERKNNQPVHTDTIRYALTLIHLERKLSKVPHMLKTISERLEQVQDQVAHFGINHTNVMANLASLYLDTISTLRPRIQVTGDPQYLQQQANADKIRATLLAGVRSAMLWYQVGGRRWHLLFYRKKLLSALNHLGY